MKAKEYLLQIEMLDCKINNMLEEVQRWKNIAYSTGAWSEGERVQSSGNKQKMASAVDRYVDLQAEIDSEIDRLWDKKQEIKKTLGELTAANEYDVLYKVYVLGKTFQEVADEKDKSYSWATSVHGRALSSLQRVLDERKDYEV